MSLFAWGCSSGGGGHRVYTGPAYLKDPALAWINQGRACTAQPIPRPFDPARDSVTVQLLPGDKGGDWWSGVDPVTGSRVGGWTQLQSPWPADPTKPYRMTVGLFCDPNQQPLQPDPRVAYHELGGHVNLIPSEIYDHPSRFKACYPIWRVIADPMWPGDQTPELDGPIGRHVVYGPNGEVLHECGETNQEEQP